LTAGGGSGGEAAQVRLGGYGELHYNSLSGRGGASDRDEIDFHRFVLYVGYDFSDRIRFSSEVELEHSLSSENGPGEVELEQAFVDFDLTEDHVARAGLFLLPVGLINPTHEPTRFYGVERNSVENRIIPTTWWEAGVGVQGYLGDVQYAAYVHSGLNTSSNSNYVVRSGRQKVAEAEASDIAGTVAVNWRIPGVAVGGALVYQSDIAQGNDPTAGQGVLGEAHMELRKGALALRTLYAEWMIDGEGPESVGADRQYGWYVEPAFRPVEVVGLFARYSEWNNQAGRGDHDTAKSQINLGINWWPHEQVVVKTDYQWQDNEDGKERDGFNLGIGYDL